MKITRRTQSQVWEYPLSRRDYNHNVRLRDAALALAQEMDT